MPEKNAANTLIKIIIFVAAGVAHLYSHVSKPLLDATLITFSLFRLSRDQQSNTSAGTSGSPGTSSPTLQQVPQAPSRVSIVHYPLVTLSLFSYSIFVYDY